MDATELPMSTWDLLQSLDFMAIEIQMVLSAILIIYVGAHASLRRPPSAAPPATNDKTKRTKNGKAINDDKEQFAPGFEASDAIFFPILAGASLIGLYYLIQWLQDPAILNTILRWYMSLTGVVGIGTLLGNAMQVLLGFVFPEQWLDRKGNIWRIDSRRRAQISDGSSQGRPKNMPFPGVASVPSVSLRRSKALFTIRHLVLEDWHLKINIFGICKETIPYKLTTFIGYLLGVVLQGAYLYAGGNLLSNMVGLSLCYTAFTFISLTSFTIGTYVLGGLFVYDIVMVFYTPFMVAVATQIDAPIKLSFSTATRSSMLGLGDIVLPGVFICLALRFDLWMHYRRQIKQVETDLETVRKEQVPADGLNAETTKEITTVTKATRDVKAPFVDPRGQWGNYFWTTAWRNLVIGGNSSAQAVADSAFPKTYFHATIVGYLLGMFATIGILLTFKRGQPALLYLVPGVIGSVYLTGLWRGEIKEIFLYTENGTLDTKEVVVDVDANGKPVAAELEAANDDASGDGSKNGVAGEDEQQQDYELVYVSITVPKEKDELKED
ncbi:unnamed protein product [Discula destructiva]